jgi:hypothetical protein
MLEWIAVITVFGLTGITLALLIAFIRMTP